MKAHRLASARAGAAAGGGARAPQATGCPAGRGGLAGWHRRARAHVWWVGAGRIASGEEGGGGLGEGVSCLGRAGRSGRAAGRAPAGMARAYADARGARGRASADAPR